MSGFFIISVIVIIIIVIFNAGGKELDRRLSLYGGIKSIYEPLIEAFLDMPNADLLKVKPSSVIIIGNYRGLHYEWKTYTPDGKKLTIRFIVRNHKGIVEKKIFDFPMTSEWISIPIPATLHNKIQHKEILEN